MPVYVTEWSCGLCSVSIPEAQLPSCGSPRRRGEETRARADLFHHDDRDGVNAMTAAHLTRIKLLGKQNLEHQSISLGFRYWARRPGY